MGIKQKIKDISKILRSKSSDITTKASINANPGQMVSFVGFNNFKFPYANLKAYYRAYQVIPQLRAIIDSSAKAFSRSNVTISETKPDQSVVPITSGDLFNVLNNPHPLYDSKTFKELFYKHWQLFDRVHVLKNIPEGMPEAIGGMYILPTPDTYIIPKKGVTLNDIAFATDINQIIEKYVVEFQDKFYDFEPSDVWTLMNGSLSMENEDINLKYGSGNFLYPDEKMKGLEKPLKIIAASYDTDLELKINYGALGIMSTAAKDGQGGNIDLQPDDIEELQDDYKKYGTSKERYKMMFAKRPMMFTAISLPIEQLKIPEGIRNQKVALCDAFSFPILLLNELEQSTFSNMGVSSKTLYTDKVIPETERIQMSMNNTFNLQNTNISINFDFSHIEVLQADKKDEALKNKINVATIVSVNVAVFRGEMSKVAAANTLSRTLKISTAEANTLLS